MTGLDFPSWQNILAPALTVRTTLHQRGDQIVVAFHDSLTQRPPLEEMPEDRVVVVDGPGADLTTVASALLHVASRQRAEVAALLGPELQQARALATTPESRIWFVMQVQMIALQSDLIALRDSALRTGSATRADTLDQVLLIVDQRLEAARRFGPRGPATPPAPEVLP